VGVNPRSAEARDARAPLSEERTDQDDESRSIDELTWQTRRFLERNVDAARIDRHACIEPELLAGAAKLGLFGLTIPEAYGGLGLSLRGACRIIAEIARIDRSVAITIGLHAGLGTRGLIEYGSAETKAEWLPILATGAAVAAFGATEPGAGSDVAAISMHGRPVQGGLIVNGEKSYVTNGGFAGLFTVLVRTPSLGGRRTFSLVVIPKCAPGLSIGREEQKLGIRGSSTVSLHLDDVFVPDRCILGAQGRGLEHIAGILAWGRTLLAAGCVGTARAALSAAVRHVTHRRQFGRTLGEFSSTRRLISDMAAALYAMDALVDWVGRESASGTEILRSSAAAKIFCSETSFEVVDRALQLHGALGFLEPTGIAQLLRDVRVTRIFEGANEVLLVREGTDRMSRSCAAGGASAPFTPSDSNPRLHGLIELWTLHNARFGQMLTSVREKFGIKVVHHQTLLQALARGGISLDVAAAVIRRANRVDLSPDEFRLAEHAVCRQLDVLQQHLDEAEPATTSEARELALSEAVYLEHGDAVNALYPVHA